VNKVKTKEE